MNSPAPTFRDATSDDLPAVVRLILEDSMSATAETGAPPDAPQRALEAVDADSNNRLIVVEQDGAIIGTCQLTFIPSLTHRGGWIAQVGNVRVDGTLRGQGLGQQLMEWCIQQARERGCSLFQLSSNNARERAHAFYKRLGFAQSHAGFKLNLEP